MEKFSEEELPRIKPPFVWKTPEDKENLRKWIIDQEAKEQRPPITRKAKIVQVVGSEENRIFVLMYHDIPFFMFLEEAPLGFKKMKNDDIVGKVIPFKISGVYEDKYLASYRKIEEYYKIMSARSKIIKGKITKVILTSRPDQADKYSKSALVSSKGDEIKIPARDFVYPNIMPVEDVEGHVCEFIVKDVYRKDGKLQVIGSIKDVRNYRNEQLDYFFDNDISFKAVVERVGHFGAYLTYKHNNVLVLRNKDFSSNYTACKDILSPGDTIEVKIKTKTEDGRYIVEMLQKYNVEPSLDLSDIIPSQTYEGEVRKVNTFGAFVHIATGRDVLCPINFDAREPIEGDKVKIEIVVSNKELGHLRGKIIKYEDDIPDLTEFNLIGENYDY